MKNSIKFVGLDVHKETIAVAVADAKGGAARSVGTIPNQPEAVRQLLQRLGRKQDLRLCYEAGPCGYELYRHCRELDVVCLVIAPSLIPRRPGDRVKTDRRDALKLAGLFRAGELTPVCVPSPADEALRDLTRARSDAMADRLRANNRLGKLLLRQGVRPPKGVRSGTKAHTLWLAGLRMAEPARQVVLDDYRQAVEQTAARVKRLEEAILDWASTSVHTPLLNALQAFRGVGLITAATLVAELGNPARFDRARQVMKYLGMVPSESSSGASRRRGAITKAGNSHARFVTVETAWHYRHKPTVSRDLARRQRGQSEAVKALSLKTQQRLHHKYWLLINRNKTAQQTAVAVGREFLGFVWAMAKLVETETAPVAS